MRLVVPVVLVLLAPALARAQEQTPPPSSPAPSEGEPASEWNQPPLVDAPTQEPKASTPATEAGPGTPPPPGYTPQGAPQVPYPYSPYGRAEPQEPPPEIGLMFTEAAFGTLSAAGSGLLLYFLLLRPLTMPPPGSVSPLPENVANIIFLLTFATVPLAVAQTEVNLANGSRYYYSESWPASLSGLLTQSAILGAYYLLRGVDTGFAEIFLLSGTVLAVPLVEMAVINLTKTPRWKLPGGGIGSLVRYDDRHGFRWGIPTPSPVPVFTATGVKLGVGATLASGHF